MNNKLIPYRFILSTVLLFLFGGCMNQAQGEQKSTTNASGKAQASAVDVQSGRDFRDLSIFPNSEELLLVEVNEKKLPEHSRVLRYNLKQNSLQHYALPKGYAYTDAKISPSGNYIVMKRVKEVDVTDEAKVRETLGNPEIAIMKSDGTDFRVLKLNPGFKHGPILSNDDSRIAYWRGTLRKPHSKSLASQLDIWEFDLKTGADVMFAGPFDFFEGAQMQYLPGDNEILFHADGPRAHAQFMSDYSKRYNRSQAYRVTRTQSKLPEPILTEVSHADYPTQGKNGDLILLGQSPTISLFKKSAQGQLTQWLAPKSFWGPNGITTIDVAANGAFIAFIYSLPDEHYDRFKEKQTGIGMLIQNNSEWKTLSTPPLESSTPIVVKLAQ